MNAKLFHYSNMEVLQHLKNSLKLTLTRTNNNIIFINLAAFMDSATAVQLCQNIIKYMIHYFQNNKISQTYVCSSYTQKYTKILQVNQLRYCDKISH